MKRLCSLALCLAALTRLAAEEPKPPRTDLYGDPLPPGAVARLGTIRLHHPYADLAFTQDGKQMISVDGYGEVRFWDAVTGQRLQTKRLPLPESFHGSSVQIAHDGTMAAVWQGKAVHLYDSHTAKERGRIPCVAESIHGAWMTFSTNGKYLAVMTNQKDQGIRAHLCDMNAMKIIQTLKMPAKRFLSSVAFSPDGKCFAGLAEKIDDSEKSESDSSDLSLWDTNTGKLLQRRANLRGIDSGSLAFSPDGKTLVVGGRPEAVLSLLSADTLEEKSRLTAPAAERANCLGQPVFSPDGRWLAAVCGFQQRDDDNFNRWEPRTILLWDLRNLKEPQRLPVSEGIPHDLTGIELFFSPDGKTLVRHDVCEIRLFDTASGRPLHRRPGHRREVQTFAVSPDGKLLASGDVIGIVRLWDLTAKIQRSKLEGSRNSADFCFFSTDGRRVATRAYFGLQVWQVSDGKPLGRIEAKEERDDLGPAAFSADGKYVRGIYTQGSVAKAQQRIWDCVSAKCLSRSPYALQQLGGGLIPRYESYAAFSADGERVTVWLGDRVGIADATTGALLAKLPKGIGNPLFFSPDGRLLTTLLQRKQDKEADQDVGEWLLLEAASGQEIVRWKGKNSQWEMAFTLDSRALVAADSENLHVWDTATGEELHRMTWPDGLWRKLLPGMTPPYIPHLAALPGGHVATSMPEGDILIWDLHPSHWPTHTPKRERDRAASESQWSDLAGDAAKAYRAIAALTTAPHSTISFLQEHVRAAEGRPIEQLLADLDSDSFARREAASQKLKSMCYRAEPMLRQTLQNKPSLEQRRRIEAILTEPRLPQTEDLRNLRAIAVLERIGTPEARRIVEKLASGAAAPETRAAQAALQRLKRRDASANGRTTP